MSRLTSRSIVLLTLSLACVSALSQPAKAAAPQIASIGNTAAPLSASSPTLPPDIAAKVEQHNKQLHNQLQITPAQQPQWDRFTEVTRSDAADIGQAFSDRGAKLDTMTASDNMQSFAHVAQVHAANMQRVADAFQALYATFSSEQKQVADGLFRNKLAKSSIGYKHAG